MHALVLEAIQIYVQREELRERRRVETLEALAHYEATGEYVAGEDVIEWMKTWGTPDERPAPTWKVRR